MGGMRKGVMAAIDVGALKKIPDAARRMALAMKGDLEGQETPKLESPKVITSEPTITLANAASKERRKRARGNTIIESTGMIV